MNQPYEKLGAFYLGRSYDVGTGALGDDPILYDSKDLVTHGVCFGMTGSGKTGLCVCLLEEALIDGIPVIAIDPKGDLGNLLLTFPDLKPKDFEPWIQAEAARREGLTPTEYAANQAKLWRTGLAEWHQDGDRIRKLRQAAEPTIYTPGSSAGLPVSLLKSFQAPGIETLEDEESMREQVQASVAGLLGLLGLDADPIQSRENILLSMILAHAWNEQRDLSLANLIPQIQKPPFDRVGMFDLESYYPSKERRKLATALNGLLVSPGFSSWLEGTPLDIDRLLYSDRGKPRLSIFSIAHLNDRERMFFVSALLNRIVSWMRQQSGTSTLRALIYMDEIYGFLPPVANPPSKPPLLTLLKQARAYGLGVLMATQNPKDLDYKALSNAGTWFVGRLQTDRDQERVLDGLEGAAVGSGARFDRQETQAEIASLDKRVFLLHNVHEDRPIQFHTRWALSYLGGPLTRRQIKTLMADRKADLAVSHKEPIPKAESTSSTRPLVPDGIQECFAPVSSIPPEGAVLAYHPLILGEVRTHYQNAKYRIDMVSDLTAVAELDDDVRHVHWEESEEFDLAGDDMEREPPSGPAEFAELPASALKKTSYTKWTKQLGQWVYSEKPLQIFRSPSLKEFSRPEESERDFRVRLEQNAREHRDLNLEKLRRKFAPKVAQLEDRIRRAEGAVEREKGQARQHKLQSTISIGATLVGALFGRKLGSATNVRGAGSAVRSMSRASREKGDIQRAVDNLESLRERLYKLEADFEADCAAVESSLDIRAEELESVRIRARKSNINVRSCTLTWLPSWQTGDGRQVPAWR